MVAFATPDDLAERLQVEFDVDDYVRATGLIEQASGLVQRTTRQTITQVVGDVITLPATYTSLLMLPELPVTAVASLVYDGSTWTDGTDYAWTTSGLIVTAGRYAAIWSRPTVVTYTHGYATVPDDIVSIVIDMSARAWQNPRGVLSEQIGTYSARYPAGQTGLTVMPDEAMLLHQYRPVPG